MPDFLDNFVAILVLVLYIGLVVYIGIVCWYAGWIPFAAMSVLFILSGAAAIALVDNASEGD